MSRRAALTAVAVFAAAFFVHARSLAGAFVYDDHRFIEQNRAIETVGNPVRFLTDPATASADTGIEPDIWRPLRTLHFAADRALFGLRPFAWHLENALLHAANAVLVWLLLARLFGCRPFPSRPADPPRPGRGAARSTNSTAGASLAAAAGALLFAVHPATSESVAWVSSRGDLLALFLMLLSFETLSKAGTLRTVVGVALAALALLAKESAIVAAPLLFLVDRAVPESERLPLRARRTRAALLAGVAVLYLVARNAVLPGGLDREFLVPEGGRSALVRGMLAGFSWYARVLVWPAGFPFDYRQPIPLRWTDADVVLGAALLATILLAGIRALRRGDHVLAFACIGALVALAPVSNVLVPLKALTAERFLYPLLPCLAAGAGLLVARLGARLQGAWRPALAGVALVLLGALARETWARDGAWHDEESLWTAVRAEDPTNPRAYEGLGFVYGEQGHLSRAEHTYRTFREWQPDDGKSMAYLGKVYQEVAGTLSADDPEMAAHTNVLARRRFALKAAIEAYQAALETWVRVGLVRGRGSEALRRDTLSRLREAALDLGDFENAKRANDLLGEDDVRRLGAPAYGERRMRAILASLVVEATVRLKPEEKTIERERTRATLLRDVGVDPNLSDPDAAAALLAPLTALLREGANDASLHRFRADTVLVAVNGRRDVGVDPLLRVALEDFDALVAADPDDVELRKNRDGLRAMLRSPR